MRWLSKQIGLIIAWFIILLWSLCLILLLIKNQVDFTTPLPYVLILMQTFLYTGLFITGHDAMHGGISKNKVVNKITGTIAIGLFAFNAYWRLFPRHHQHHQFVGTEKDPDYHHGSFIFWYYNFLKQYVTIWQLLLMAAAYNLLILFFPVINVVSFWIVPAVLSTFQLFYFGTYVPHKNAPHISNVHKSDTLPKNHWWAFVTCYFFGYHFEHHSAPGVPWWQLYKEKK